MKEKDFIRKLEKKGIVPGLSAMRQLLDQLGHPEKDLSVIHAAGTNGKGSVIAFLSSILQEAGYTVGTYTSPAVFAQGEQFQINGAVADPGKINTLWEEIEAAVRELERKGRETPSLFEAETALAFLLFKEARTDYVLLEAGMGGLLDATNVVKKPVLTVITSISYDHTAWLGGTLTEIARHKAGIIKPGIPVVVSHNPEEVMTVIRDRACRCHSSLTEVRKEEYQILSERIDGSRFCYKGEIFEIRLPGSHQVMNAVTALRAADILLGGGDGGPSLSAGEQTGEKSLSSLMKRALLRTVWPGRLQIINHSPLTILDGAHNPDGARKLSEFLQKHFTNRKILYIMGMLKDKDYEKMVALLPHGEAAFVFRPENRRGLDADLLESAVSRAGMKAFVCRDVCDALDQAEGLASEEDVIVICGSLSFMGQLRSSYADRWS